MAGTLLVTGSEGNIGAYVCASVRRLHPDLRVVRVTRSGAHGPEVRYGDLSDPAFVRRLFSEERIDTVMHLAATRYSARGFREASYDLFANDLGTLLQVLGASTGVKKFVYASSALVYESAQPPLVEDSPESAPPPRSSYGFAKLAGERAVRQFTEQYGVPHTIWRPFNVVSPREPHDGDGHVFTDLYRRIFVERAPEIALHGGGTQVRCFTWVEDVADAMASFLPDARTDNETFNLGAVEPTSLSGLASLMLELGREKGALPDAYRPEIVAAESFAGTDTAVRIPSLAKAEERLGWRAPTALRACFSRFLDHKLAHHDD